MEVISMLGLPGNNMGWKKSPLKIWATEPNAKSDTEFGRLGLSSLQVASASPVSRNPTGKMQSWQHIRPWPDATTEILSIYSEICLLHFMVSLQERCTVTRNAVERTTAQEVIHTLSIMQNGNKSLLSFLRIENIGKLIKLLCLSNCVYYTDSGALAAAVRTPIHAFIFITRRNKYVLKDTVRSTATFSEVTELNVVTSPGWAAKWITWL